jgi:alginate O-acetyltransferase complex protein AlgI
MVFSSLLFIIRFLPLVLVFVYFTPSRFRNGILLILSLIFYAWGDVVYIGLMLSSIGVDYLMALGIDKNPNHPFKKKLFLAGSLAFNLGLLGIFKYLGFFSELFSGIFLGLSSIQSFVLPLGISFYTFQTMSYTLDVYKGTIRAERNLIDFGAYVSLFPQLIAGPIIQYKSIKDELKTPELNADKFMRGLKLFTLGLGSKVLIANEMGVMWESIKALEHPSMPLAWLGITGFGFQIYFDFLGYSLMAMGLGLMLGFTFMENFNHPYIAKSISEFFRRWHISLGQWFKEYVYIPLGGNKIHLIRNLLIVWALTGLWHGASLNYVLWGLYFFILIALEKKGMGSWLKKHPIIAHFYVIIAVLIGWVIFQFEDLSRMGEYFGFMMSLKMSTDVFYYVSQFSVLFIFAAVLSTPFIKKHFIKTPPMVQGFLLVLIFLVSIAYLVDASYNPFLYFRF